MVLIIWFSYLLILSVRDEGYSRNVSYARNVISPVLLLYTDFILCKRALTASAIHGEGKMCLLESHGLTLGVS